LPEDGSEKENHMKINVDAPFVMRRTVLRALAGAILIGALGAYPKDELLAETLRTVESRLIPAVRPLARVQKTYILLARKKGLKLQRAQQGPPTIVETKDGFLFRNVSMAMVCDFLSRFLESPVFDQTGLNGSFDFTLKIHSGWQQAFSEWGESNPSPTVQDHYFISIRKEVQGFGLQFKIK
jgi:hypothetical protein